MLENNSNLEKDSKLFENKVNNFATDVLMQVSKESKSFN